MPRTDLHRRVSHPVEGVSLAKQQFKDECDINYIMARYTKTGLITHLAAREPMYLDVSEVPDFKAASDYVLAVREYFASLPSTLREEFDNDPAEFIAGFDDPETAARLASYGIERADEAPHPSGEPEAPQGASGELEEASGE